jgi:chemotaxis protein MotA
MFFIIGFLVVVGAVLTGYWESGGKFSVLWKPAEWLVIFGAGIGGFIIANPPTVLKGVGKGFGSLIKGPKYKKEAYMELLGVLYSVFKLAKSKGDLALETHVEQPDDSTIFQKFPTFHGNHHAVEFLCDYLRLLTLGTSNSHEVESMMEQELEIHHDEHHAVSGALLVLADSFPALGIVAAVLGVIITMGSITEPPEVLGELIGGALVGTFSGILVSYGIAAPIASSVGATHTSEGHYMLCIKAGIIAHMQGYAPQVSVEFARKTMASDMRPTFAEVEEMIGGL